MYDNIQSQKLVFNKTKIIVQNTYFVVLSLPIYKSGSDLSVSTVGKLKI